MEQKRAANSSIVRRTYILTTVEHSTVQYGTQAAGRGCKADKNGRRLCITINRPFASLNVYTEHQNRPLRPLLSTGILLLD